MLSTLKLVILYDARNNAYTVFDHNLTPEEAEKKVAELKAKSLFALAVDQEKRHRNPDPQACRVCRRDVGRASGLTPTPRFERRSDR